MTHWKTMHRLTVTLVLVILLLMIAQAFAGQVLGKTLADRVRQADVIGFAEVRAVKVQTFNETFDRETKTYQRPRQGKFEDAGLVELDKLLHEHRIGAW